MPLPVFIAPATPRASRFSKLEWRKEPNGGVSTYRQGIYCGPGWGFTYKDILDGKIKALPKAIDAIDEACKLHDECYEENGYFTQGCNIVLTVNLSKVIISESSSPQQRVDAAIMAAIFFVESQTIDVGVMAKRDYDQMRERMLGQMRQSAQTLAAAINREISMRRTKSPKK